MPRNIAAYKEYQAKWRRNRRKLYREKVRAQARERYHRKREIILKQVKDSHVKRREKIIASKKKKYYSQSYEARRDKSLKTIYGITHAEYLRMYEACGGACYICGDFHKVLNIDHCHQTRKIRGLLCGRCNKGIGFFRDQISKLENAIKYLQASEAV